MSIYCIAIILQQFLISMEIVSIVFVMLLSVQLSK